MDDGDDDDDRALESQADGGRFLIYLHNKHICFDTFRTLVLPLVPSTFDFVAQIPIIGVTRCALISFNRSEPKQPAHYCLSYGFIVG
jgi:hypothetical protein